MNEPLIRRAARLVYDPANLLHDLEDGLEFSLAIEYPGWIQLSGLDAGSVVDVQIRVHPHAPWAAIPKYQIVDSAPDAVIIICTPPNWVRLNRLAGGDFEAWAQRAQYH